MYILRVGSDDSLAVGDFFFFFGASEGAIFVSTLYLSFSLTFPKPSVSRWWYTTYVPIVHDLNLFIRAHTSSKMVWPHS